jgi:hypothetical protein
MKFHILSVVKSTGENHGVVAFGVGETTEETTQMEVSCLSTPRQRYLCLFSSLLEERIDALSDVAAAEKGRRIDDECRAISSAFPSPGFLTESVFSTPDGQLTQTDDYCVPVLQCFGVMNRIWYSRGGIPRYELEVHDLPLAPDCHCCTNTSHWGRLRASHIMACGEADVMSYTTVRLMLSEPAFVITDFVHGDGFGVLEACLNLIGNYVMLSLRSELERFDFYVKLLRFYWEARPGHAEALFLLYALTITKAMRLGAARYMLGEVFGREHLNEERFRDAVRGWIEEKALVAVDDSGNHTSRAFDDDLTWLKLSSLPGSCDQGV